MAEMLLLADAHRRDDSARAREEERGDASSRVAGCGDEPPSRAWKGAAAAARKPKKKRARDSELAPPAREDEDEVERRISASVRETPCEPPAVRSWPEAQSSHLPPETESRPPAKRRASTSPKPPPAKRNAAAAFASTLSALF